MDRLGQRKSLRNMMRGSRLIARVFPFIQPNSYERHSYPTRAYNCIAYAAGDIFAWWDPYGYWPNADAGERLGHLIEAFKTVGFADCGQNCLPEPGYEKVALYQDVDGKWTHAARLRPDGWWES